MTETQSRAYGFAIEGMTCAHCELAVERVMRGQPGVSYAEVRYDRGRAIVDASNLDVAALTHALGEEGYKARVEPLTPDFLAPKSSGLRRGTEAAGLIMAVFALVVLARHFHLVPDGVSVSEHMTLGLVFAIGLVASVSSCMAVTGGLLLAVSARYQPAPAQRSLASRMLPHVFFNAGRVISYTLFGAAIGHAGSALAISGIVAATVTIAASVLMMTIGAQMLGLLPPFGRMLSLPPTVQQRIHDLVLRETNVASFALGAATFFLPCGFTLALQLYVLGQGSALMGALTMLVFALGTLPALAAISAASGFVRGRAQAYFLKAAGAAVIVLGLFNIQYGLVQGAGSDAPAIAIAQEANVPPSGTAQVATMTVDGLTYRPNRFTVKVGQPVEWHIDARLAEGCGRILVARSIGLTRFLSDQRTEVIRFTPQRSGEIVFNCSMGMMTPNSGFTVTN